MKRTDIAHTDVFISWTSADEVLKNQIVAYLRANGITCTESSRECSGDFAQWSREAATKSTVFLLLYTSNAYGKHYVHDEIESFLTVDDPANRCIPLVSDTKLYAQILPQLAQRTISAISIGESQTLADDKLEEIHHKVRNLISNRLFANYRHASAPTYLRLVSLMPENPKAEEFDHTRLYIKRSVTDEEGQVFSDAAAFCKTRDIIYLVGPAGSGKTCYVDQLRNAADEDTLVITLLCRDLLNTTDLFSVLFTQFCKYFSNQNHLTPDNFKSLLSVKHLLVVLDGLDEIATKKGKDALFRVTRDYYVANASSTTLIITSRSSADAPLWKMNGQTPKIMNLHALEEDQIKDFGNNLFLLLGSTDKSEEFYIRAQDLAEEIRSNPLFLSQLAIIYNERSQLPQTTVGIYDTICQIMVDKITISESVPADFDRNILRKLSDILKSFSAERYNLLSQGKVKTTEQIFKKVLQEHQCDVKDATALIRYLQDRAILVGNDFYHKMLPEYFTAVYYYENSFDHYDELEHPETLRALFDHYDDPYWSAVLQMFLIKADSCVDEDTGKELYHRLMGYDHITDFTLLFDTCQKLVNYKAAAQTVLLENILARSAQGIYPPYGPLFWYVPEYDLYDHLLSALTCLQDDPCFTKALALSRDVCWICAKYHSAAEVDPHINGQALLAKADLTGIRKGLCELFYQGFTIESGGQDIYPRCFNIAESRHWKDIGCGLFCRMNTPFEDELGLYSHEMLRDLGGEWVGFVAMDYDVTRIEEILPVRSCKKLCGLFLAPTEETQMQKLAINNSHIRNLYLPENLLFAASCNTLFPSIGEYMLVSYDGSVYFRNRLILPEGLTMIPDKAFLGCSALASIVLPSSVTEIGNSAFEECSSLTCVTLPESVSKIGAAAFHLCSSLSSVTIPKGVTTIDECAFEECSSLTSITIPDTVTEIGFCAFGGCSSLTAVTIPDGVTEIGGSVFEGCTSLAAITLPEGITKIGLSAFEECTSLTSITIPENVTEIGGSVFEGCTSLTSIIIPEGVSKIDWSTFYGCTALTSVTLPESLTHIEGSAFEGCSALTSITIPNGVRQLSWDAFKNCRSVCAIRLPDGLLSLDQSTFRGCTALRIISNCPLNYSRAFFGVSDECTIFYRLDASNLDSQRRQTITEISFPQGITEIEDEAFTGYVSLVSVIIPDGVTKIGNRAFLGCNSLSSIIIPKSVIEIGDQAFVGCNCLNSVNIPEGVSIIGVEAFAHCNSLASIMIPGSVTQIGSAAFEGCRFLTSVTIRAGVESIPEGCFAGCSALTQITIPDSVTEIGESAFDNCSALTEFTLPDQITEIADRTFHWCSLLKSVHIPKGVCSIGWAAFSGCRALTSITLPENLTCIEGSAFEGCTALSSITIPDGVAEIGGCAFEGCNSLTSIVIPESVNQIRGAAFEECSSLTYVTIADGVTEIGAAAFKNCTALTSITIPTSVSKIGMCAFEECNSLTSVVIPKSVRFVEHSAFRGCTGLQKITLSRQFEDELANIFKDVDLSNITIHWH